jgi:putative phage-type endonuclease
LLNEQEESWLATRHKGIGGTDIAGILNLSPWRKPIDVYVSKVEPEKEEPPDSEAVLWGTLLEPVIRQRYAHKFHVQIFSPSALGKVFPRCIQFNDHAIVVGAEPWQLASPDGDIDGGNALLEIKCSGRRGDEWGNGEDEIPAQYILQAQWYCHVTGRPAVNFAVLFNGNTLAQYRVVHDEQLIRDLMTAAGAFWHDHVLMHIPPPIDESESYGRYLARRFSLGTENLVPCTPEIEDEAHRLKAVENLLSEAEAVKQLHKNKLMSLVADGKKCITPIGSIQWVRSSVGSQTDWEAVAQELKAPEDVILRHTHPTQRIAYLRAWWKKDKAKQVHKELQEGE